MMIDRSRSLTSVETYGKTNFYKHYLSLLRIIRKTRLNRHLPKYPGKYDVL